MGIPYIIHQIWVGPNPLPKKSEEFIKQIKELHPNFTYILWTDRDVTPTNFINYDYIEKVKSYAQKADIMRYEILYKYGGVYIDIDFEIYKNIEPLLINDLVICHEDPFSFIHMSIGLIACCKYNPNLKRCVENIHKINFTQPINVATGPVYFRSNIHMNDTVTLLDTNVLYPVHWIPYNIYSYFKAKEYTQSSFDEDTYGIHHWDKSW